MVGTKKEVIDMRENKFKSSTESENRITFLEGKLKNILRSIEYIIDGKNEDAKDSMKEYKESTAHIIIGNLIAKSEKDASPKINPEDKSYIFLKIILNSVPFPVFIKDENSRYLLINSLEENLFGIKESEILGKHDRDFVHNSAEMEIIQNSDNQVLNENKSIELPNQHFSLPDGRSFIFKTHKIPFINPITGKRNILGFSLDITDTVNLDKLKKILIMNSPYL
jgi:PAS domain S-box-containing protein